MPTLKEYIREAIRRGGAEVGRVVPVTGLSTTTVTAAALADGSPSQAYANWFATRRETATATDRKRIISAFAGSTGACTIQGANYGDTTATDGTRWCAVNDVLLTCSSRLQTPAFERVIE